MKKKKNVEKLNKIFKKTAKLFKKLKKKASNLEQFCKHGATSSFKS